MMGRLSPTNNGAPKAYLNWLIFDRKYRFITGGFKQITTAAKEAGTGVLHERIAPGSDIVIAEPGYVYVYLSNEETGTPVEVYFDDFKVEHIKSPVVQQDDYYPFGLAFNSYQRENAMVNQYQYNGKEMQDELNLGWLDYGARMYMSDLGRWGVIDPMLEQYRNWNPYNYTLNNPLRFIDPTGMTVEDPDGIVTNQKKTLNENLSVVDAALKQEGLSDEMKQTLSQLSSGFTSSLNEIATLEKSDQVYAVFYNDGKEGGVSYDLSSNKVKIGIPKGEGIGLTGHELKHAYQFENGEVSLKTNNAGYGALYDITDETAGYNRERSLFFGISFYQDPTIKFNDQNTKDFGKTMKPIAYQTLPPGPININSMEGLKMRMRTTADGLMGRPPGEVYKCRQNDYNSGAAIRTNN